MTGGKKQESSSPKKAGILLVDDHPMVRERLAEVINQEPDLRVCGEAESRHQALEVIAANEPDLVIIDLTLKQSHGLDLIKDIRVRHPRLAMLVLSMHDESLQAERVIRAGARGYITKQRATRDILVAIRQVLAGNLYMSDAVAAQIASRISGQRPQVVFALDKLTDRELRVFELIGQGHPMRQIAEELHLDVKTVETYRARIKEKLNLKDAGEVLRLAIRWGRAAGQI